MSKTKKPITHVGLQEKSLVCFHCGQRVQVVPDHQGLPITMLVASMKEFEKLHARCKETDESPTRKLERNEFEWEQGFYVGSSSATIFAVMVGRMPSGIGKDRIGALPQDPDDFSRCHRLLRVKPEWRQRLGEVAVRFQAWSPLVENWDRLTEMFEQKEEGMYAYMKQLTKESASA